MDIPRRPGALTFRPHYSVKEGRNVCYHQRITRRDWKLGIRSNVPTFSPCQLDFSPFEKTTCGLMTLSCQVIAQKVLGDAYRISAGEAYDSCPNHDDRHPSLKINTNKNVFLCGPCGVSGGAWHLLHS